MYFQLTADHRPKDQYDRDDFPLEKGDVVDGFDILTDGRRVVRYVGVRVNGKTVTLSNNLPYSKIDPSILSPLKVTA